MEQLEQIIREKSTVSIPQPPPAPATLASVDEDFDLSYGSPAPDLHFGPDFSTVTIETVLAWDVFRGRFDSQRELKALLKEAELPPSPIISPVGETIPLINSLELGSCNRLLDSFLTRVHIANPILDVELVRGYVNHACLHGVGWDAPSCLVVGSLDEQHRMKLTQDFESSLFVPSGPLRKPFMTFMGTHLS